MNALSSFVSTRYWCLVRAYVLNQSGQRCERCGAAAGLEVNHSAKIIKVKSYPIQMI